MGSRYLTDLADVCRQSGYPVVEVEGWQSRARGSGGFNDGAPAHGMLHHTASGPSSDGWPDVNYLCFGDSDAPLANLYLSRDGTIYICAAGATNTNGSGTDPCGHIAPDTMNTNAIGIEAGNNGTGEQWPEVQQSAYVALCRVLSSAYGILIERFHGHAEYAVGRKIDPAGNSRYATGGATWNFDAFRTDIAGTQTPPPEEPPVELEEDDMPRYLVAHPATGEWFVTDMATYRTYVGEPGLAAEGIALFGWESTNDSGPIGLGPGWAPFLDQLPRT